MAGRTSALLAAGLIGAMATATVGAPALRAAPQSRPGPPGPGEPFLGGDGSLAVLLEDADLYTEASADSEVVTRVEAGTVLDFGGEAPDIFGRAWSAVRDPNQVTQRRDSFLAPFTFAQFVDWGSAGALLAERAIVTGTKQTPLPDPVGAPWWAPEMLLVGGHAPTYQQTVGISARAVEQAHLQEAIELLGGRVALGNWPRNPLPGELFVPERLPVLYQWSDERWRPAQPVAFLGHSLSLLPNSALRIDRQAPRLAGGPALPCWDFVGALSPTGQEVGTIQEARPYVEPQPAEGEAPDPSAAAAPPPMVVEMLAPPTLGLRVPSRVDPAPLIAGVEIRDNDGKQAAYLEHTLSAELTARLRGRSLVLDIWARAPAGALGAATFGVDVEVRTVADVAGEYFSNGFSVPTQPTHVHWPFVVAEDAVAVIVRLIPVDKSVAVEQRGGIVIERVALRLPEWSPQPRSTVFPLHQVSALSYEGRRLYTRAAVAISRRSARELRDAWPALAASSWSIDLKKEILAGRVARGMTPDQVRLSWGDPEDEVPGIDPAAELLTWSYADRQATFVGGVLAGYRPPLEEAEAGPRPIVCGIEQ